MDTDTDQNKIAEEAEHGHRERGASLVEYALLLALIAIVCVVTVASIGTNLNESYSSTNSTVFP